MQSTATGVNAPTPLKVLVVEDEYLIASDISTAIAAQGSSVVGPFATVGAARAMLESGSEIDVAVLDINLRGENVFDLADELRMRHIPFLFATGYDLSVIPDRFHDVQHRQKPLEEHELVQELAKLNDAASAHPSQ